MIEQEGMYALRVGQCGMHDEIQIVILPFAFQKRKVCEVVQLQSESRTTLGHYSKSKETSGQSDTHELSNAVLLRDTSWMGVMSNLYRTDAGGDTRSSGN